ncbi:MAG TPA: FAD-dependent oxidoreductase, partial [Armatimonadota bacterium]|nr:FAD-dependent oxidoreductase [Armatimonadota bacterium]
MSATIGQPVEYELMVLGAGPGGYSAALEAARLGARVALIERDEPGGTCLHRGCIPAKTMYEASRHCEPFHEATERRYRVIRELHGQLLKLLTHPKITLIRGQGFIETPSRVRVTTGDDVQIIAAPRLVVATGSVPIMPDGLPAVGRKMDSDGATFLEALPARAVVLGGGYTGCEYAGILNTYGVPVVIVELGEHLLMTEDADVVAELTANFTARGIDVRTGTSLEEVELQPTDLLLVTVGRVPESSGVGLEQLGVRFGRRNGLVVN